MSDDRLPALLPPLEYAGRAWALAEPTAPRAHLFGRRAYGAAVARCGKVRASADALFEPGKAEHCGACARYAAVDGAR